MSADGIIILGLLIVVVIPGAIFVWGWRVITRDTKG